MRKTTAKVQSITMTANRAKGGIELRFPEAPEESTLTLLKEQGWRFSRGGGVDPRWYAMDTPAQRAWAQRLILVLDGSREVPIDPPDETPEQPEEVAPEPAIEATEETEAAEPVAVADIETETVSFPALAGARRSFF